MKKKYIKCGSTLLMALLMIIGVSIKIYSIQMAKEEKLVNEQAAQLWTEKKELRKENRDKLIQVVNDHPNIKIQTKSKILNQIAIMYFKDSEYNIGLEYAARSLYLAIKTEDSFN